MAAEAKESISAAVEQPELRSILKKVSSIKVEKEMQPAEKEQITEDSECEESYLSDQSLSSSKRAE